jgi:hypothetical protein
MSGRSDFPQRHEMLLDTIRKGEVSCSQVKLLKVSMSYNRGSGYALNMGEVLDLKSHHSRT